jgi:hypothetical protein
VHVLFVHPNFPAQFRSVAPRLAADYGWTCTFISQHSDHSLPGVRRIDYRPAGGATRSSQFCSRTFEHAVGHAHGVYNALKARPDVRPDLVVAHSGFGRNRTCAVRTRPSTAAIRSLPGVIRATPFGGLGGSEDGREWPLWARARLGMARFSAVLRR